MLCIEKTEEDIFTLLICDPQCQHKNSLRDIVRIDSRVVNNQIILFPYKMRYSICINRGPFYTEAGKEKDPLKESHQSESFKYPRKKNIQSAILVIKNNLKQSSVRQHKCWRRVLLL